MKRQPRQKPRVVDCLTCGRSFKKTASQLQKNPNSFCSRRCFSLSGFKRGRSPQTRDRTPLRYDSIFWKKVKIAGISECWEWEAFIDHDGYGRFVLYGKGYLAHRFSFMQAFGEIPANKCICHWCDNRRCVNPAHLWIGTQRDNYYDAKRKGRLPYESMGKEWATCPAKEIIWTWLLQQDDAITSNQIAEHFEMPRVWVWKHLKALENENRLERISVNWRTWRYRAIEPTVHISTLLPRHLQET